jgi:hypothetical protein
LLALIPLTDADNMQRFFVIAVGDVEFFGSQPLKRYPMV